MDTRIAECNAVDYYSRKHRRELLLYGTKTRLEDTESILRKVAQFIKVNKMYYFEVIHIGAPIPIVPGNSSCRLYGVIVLVEEHRPDSEIWERPDKIAAITTNNKETQNGKSVEKTVIIEREPLYNVSNYNADG